MFNIVELMPYSINLVNSMTLLIESKAIEKSIIAHYFNMSFMEGVFPSELKLAKVVPIF